MTKEWLWDKIDRCMDVDDLVKLWHQYSPKAFKLGLLDEFKAKCGARKQVILADLGGVPPSKVEIDAPELTIPMPSRADLIRRINRTYHDGSPKWEMVPEDSQSLGTFIFLLSSSMAPGEMDQLVSLPDYTHSNVTAFFRDYNHQTIKSAIAKTKEFAEKVNSDPDDGRVRLWHTAEGQPVPAEGRVPANRRAEEETVLRSARAIRPGTRRPSHRASRARSKGPASAHRISPKYCSARPAA